jgi:hypothetical protein
LATEALDVIGTKKNAAFLKEIFSSIDFAKHLKGCFFVPRGMIQMTSAETLKQCINTQNAYFNSVECMPIFGLSLEAAHCKIQIKIDHNGNTITSTTLATLEMATGILAVYPTNATETKGKWLIVYKKENVAQVKTFIDDELPLLFSVIPDDCLNRTIDGHEFPRRPGLQRRNGHTLTYAHILQQRIGITPATGPPRNKRAPAAIVYHEMEHLPPPKKHNPGIMNVRPPSANSTVTTESLKMNEISELIDNRINTKMAEVVRQTDVKIKAAVDPINNKMDRMEVNLNSNFENLSAQMAQMFQVIQGQTTNATSYPSPFSQSSVAAKPAARHGMAYTQDE